MTREEIEASQMSGIRQSISSADQITGNGRHVNVWIVSEMTVIVSVKLAVKHRKKFGRRFGRSSEQEIFCF